MRTTGIPADGSVVGIVAVYDGGHLIPPQRASARHWEVVIQLVRDYLSRIIGGAIAATMAGRPDRIRLEIRITDDRNHAIGDLRAGRIVRQGDIEPHVRRDEVAEPPP